MDQELKKMIAAAITTGTIVSAAVYGVAKPNCDFIIQNKGQNVCVSKELKEIAESQLPVSHGFGGIKFSK